MIELIDKVVGIWFVQADATTDWMAAVTEIKPNEEYRLDCRFRYYKDDKVFDSEDVKNWYCGTLHQTRAYVVAGLRLTAAKLHEINRLEKYELLNDGDFEDFFRKIVDASFAFAKKVSKEEAVKYGMEVK